MGCWVPKVAGKGGGAALLKDVCTATMVVEAVVKAVDVPVTDKVRSGWDAGDMTAVPFAKAAEQVGVKAIAVHGRYAKQGFQGDADWDVIRQVKETVTIPVFGNGDVKNAADARRMVALTGCDGVMIGRAALGQPWIFNHIAHEFATGESLPEPTRAEEQTPEQRAAARRAAAEEKAKREERAALREERARARAAQDAASDPDPVVIAQDPVPLVHDRASSRADQSRIYSPPTRQVAQPAAGATQTAALPVAPATAPAPAATPAAAVTPAANNAPTTMRTENPAADAAGVHPADNNAGSSVQPFSAPLP
jgi:putative N-acetylmannosamine-6-phosphate epimerase